MMLATAAAVTAAALGIAQPLIDAHKERRLQSYQDRKYQESLDAVDGQVDELLNGAIDPPWPHRATMATVLQQRFPDQAPKLLAEYDQLVTAIQTGAADAERRAVAFARENGSCAAVTYLCGLAALATNDPSTAHQHFWQAAQQQTAWIAPWLGWAAATFRQGDFEQLIRNHPHVTGVELLPYDAGDECTFLKMSEGERAELCEQFQQAATSLGNYYTAAQFCKSKHQIVASRHELRQVA